MRRGSRAGGHGPPGARAADGAGSPARDADGEPASPDHRSGLHAARRRSSSTQCSTSALAAALTAVAAALDDCDEHFVAVTSSGADGSFAVARGPRRSIQTASGAVDCRRSGACLLGALNLDALQGRPLQVACCRSSFTSIGRACAGAQAQQQLLSETYGSPPLTVARPSRTALDAYPAAALGAGRIGTGASGAGAARSRAGATAGSAARACWH